MEDISEYESAVSFATEQFLTQVQNHYTNLIKEPLLWFMYTMLCSFPNYFVELQRSKSMNHPKYNSSFIRKIRNLNSRVTLLILVI